MEEKSNLKTFMDTAHYAAHFIYDALTADELVVELKFIRSPFGVFSVTSSRLPNNSEIADILRDGAKRGGMSSEETAKVLELADEIAAIQDTDDKKADRNLVVQKMQKVAEDIKKSSSPKTPTPFVVQPKVEVAH